MVPNWPEFQGTLNYRSLIFKFKERPGKKRASRLENRPAPFVCTRPVRCKLELKEPEEKKKPEYLITYLCDGGQFWMCVKLSNHIHSRPKYLASACHTEGRGLWR